MNSYQVIDFALKLVAAGFNAEALIAEVQKREEAGATSKQIGVWLSGMCDAVLANPKE